jgi:protease secretion system membrane fusion protein
MDMATDPEEKHGFIARIDRAMDRLINSWNPYRADRLEHREMQPVAIEESKVRKSSSWLMVLVTVGFLIWAVTAPLSSGTNLSGTVTVAGYRKAVQHPSGGIVSHVYVTEGDKVKQGQVLVRINPLNSDADVANLEQEYINLLVSESRAKAELLDRPISWDPELAKFDHKAVADAKEIQTRLLSARRSQLSEQLKGYNQQISGLEGTISSHRVQLGTIADELKNTQSLAKEGYVPASAYNEKLRSKVDQEAALNSAQSSIGQIRSQMASARSSIQNDAAKELSEIQKSRDAIGAKLQAAKFSQSLTDIRAPITGTIVNTKVFTEGGVITGGEVLMEIVPDRGTLIIETKVPPQSIASIHTDQPVDLRFTSFNATTTPVVKGHVKSVGVDKQKAQPGQTVGDKDDYYLAQIETTPEDLKVLGDKQLRPGMPVDVVVKTGQRTFMGYLLKPLIDKMASAFKD